MNNLASGSYLQIALHLCVHYVCACTFVSDWSQEDEIQTVEGNAKAKNFKTGASMNVNQTNIDSKPPEPEIWLLILNDDAR